MIVEYLIFTVGSAERDAWLEADQRTWTAFLSRQPGFVSKSVWVSRDRPEEICAAIVWTDEASWKSIPQEALDAVDLEMGDLVRPPTLNVFDVTSHVTAAAADGVAR